MYRWLRVSTYPVLFDTAHHLCPPKCANACSSSCDRQASKDEPFSLFASFMLASCSQPKVDRRCSYDRQNRMEEEIVEEVYIEEDYCSDDELRLPGISEEESVGDVIHDEVEELHESSVYSVTEVEVDEDFSEVVEEEGTETEVEEVDLTEDEGATDSEIDEITLREEDFEFEEANFTNQCQVTMPCYPQEITPTKQSAATDDEETAPEDIDEEEEEDGASSKELAEAIEYILRQERAVSRFILTEDQAQTMMTLPRKVMKVIVQHFEENDGTDVDWDFLLKIVLPFCRDSGGSDDDTEGEEPVHGQYCVPVPM